MSSRWTPTSTSTRRRSRMARPAPSRRASCWSPRESRRPRGRWSRLSRWLGSATWRGWPSGRGWPRRERPCGSMIAGLRGAVVSEVADELKESADPQQSFYDVLGEVTAFFAAREPLDVPYDAPEGFVLMWTIPGTGGRSAPSSATRRSRWRSTATGAGLESAAGPIEGATIEDFQQSLEVRLPPPQLRGVLLGGIVATSVREIQNFVGGRPIDCRGRTSGSTCRIRRPARCSAACPCRGRPRSTTPCGSLPRRSRRGRTSR